MREQLQNGEIRPPDPEPRNRGRRGGGGNGGGGEDDDEDGHGGGGGGVGGRGPRGGRGSRGGRGAGGRTAKTTKSKPPSSVYVIPDDSGDGKWIHTELDVSKLIESVSACIDSAPVMNRSAAPSTRKPPSAAPPPPAPRPPPARAPPNDGDETQCSCGISAVQRRVTKEESARKGDLFWACSKGQGVGCGFFEWATEPGQRPVGSITVPAKRTYTEVRHNLLLLVVL